MMTTKNATTKLLVDARRTTRRPRVSPRQVANAATGFVDGLRRLRQDPDAPPFVDRIERLGDFRIVRLRGDIDRSIVGEGYRYLSRFARDGRALQQHLLLDCRNVEHIDTSAVALLVVCMQDYLVEDHEVALVHVGADIRDHLHISGLESRIQLFESEDEAMDAISAAASASTDG